jgi:phage tail-like protein
MPRTDPLKGYNFLISLLDSSSSLALALNIASVALGDTAAGGFSECSGLEMSLDIEEYREGGRNGEYLKFPSRVRWSNLLLKRGVTSSTTLWDWHYSFVEGRGKRRDGIIFLQDDTHTPHNVWYFRRGLPLKYSGPALNAAQSSVAIEALEITHEGLYQVPGIGLINEAAGLVRGLL